MKLSLEDPRLKEIEAIAATSPLSEVAMWSTWAQHVKNNLHQFAGEGFYLTQELPIQEYNRTAAFVFNKHQEIHPCRDVLYGAKMFETDLGMVTRAGLDSIVEMEYLHRHLPGFHPIIDIGAGYGRLASTHTQKYPGIPYFCVDAVPISTYISENYLRDMRSNAQVLTLDNVPQCIGYVPDVAINIHSWSECSIPQIERWLNVLKNVPYLFTVAHDREYSSWGGPSFRPLLESQYTQIAPEEFNACHNNCPHALWKRK